MKKTKSIKKSGRKTLPVSLLSLAISSSIFAQDVAEQEQADGESQNTERQFQVSLQNPVEEVMVLGRLQSNAQDLFLERMEFESVVDLLGAEQISRLGDSTAAAALRRVPGVTLVDGKFIYVRGLGERYSSSLLNGATVPSPDLTRNVLPLDIFPSSIIESIAVQKGYTADMPAAFGGGNIDIRTKGIPNEFVLSFELGAGVNSISDEGLDYNGGDDDNLGTDDGTRGLSSAIRTGLRTYFSSIEASEGSLSPSAIQATLERSRAPITLERAEEINARLATETYRDLNIYEDDSSIQDKDAAFSIGNIFDLGNMFEFGVLASVDYGTSIRSSDRIVRNFSDPEQEFERENRTEENVSITGSFNLGVRWGDDHEISSKNLYIRNTDDEVAITDIFNSTSGFGSGSGARNYDYRFEERQLEVYQLTGTHKLGYDTKDELGIPDSFLDDLELTWFYSDASATTEIPSETNIEASIARDVDTDTVIATQLDQGLRMMDLRYTDLQDEVESSGFEITLPMSIGMWEIELSGGGKHDSKARVFEQLDFSIGSSSSAAASTLIVGPSEIASAISDENLTNPDFDYRITYQSGLSRSYIAASKTDAFFGQVDLFYDTTWRFVLGARYEEYKQFSAPWQPFRLNGSQIRVDLDDATESDLPNGVFYQDEVYPSLALTYSRQDFWAEDFNLRFAASETVVRPDLREVSDSSYRDPLTDIVVNGNPDAIPSDITNYDLRAEWFFGSGDSLTISLFYKDIENPLEYFQNTGQEDSVTATIQNSESGESSGIEVEWLKNMGFLGDAGEAFFVSGNVTLADSEIQVGDDLDVSVTNRVRPLRGASEYVANIQFGFDSMDGKHAVTLIYNVFGERVFAAGTGEQPDSYEQPFDALDFSYSYFMNDNFSFKFKARNLLDEDVLITQGDVDVFEQTVGQSASIGLKYTF